MPRGKTAIDWDRRIDRLILDFKLPDRGALERALRDAGTEYRLSLDWGTGTPDGVGEADALDRLAAVVKQALEMLDDPHNTHTYEIVAGALPETGEEAAAWLDETINRLVTLEQAVAAIPRRRYPQGAPPKNEAVYAMIKELALYWESTGKRFRQSKKPDGGSEFVRAAIPLVLEPIRELWDQEPEFPEPQDRAINTVIKEVTNKLRERRLGIKR